LNPPSVNTVDNRGIFFDKHRFINFMTNNPIIQYELVKKQGEAFEDYYQYEWAQRNNETSPNPLDHVNQWLSDGQTDYVFVCHSQGCNIAVRLLNQTCTNK